MQTKTICAIVVTYHPTALPEALCRALERRALVIVVDNSTQSEARNRLRAWAAENNYCLIDMNGNAGIAAAQNAGIRMAKSKSALGVVFFDQDSRVDEAALTALTEAILNGAPNVYAIQPGAYWRSGKLLPPTEIRDLMSSGSGCRLTVFEAMGDFEEKLFIDLVDYEWGWRCRRSGVKLIGLRAGEFLHTLGKSEVRWLGMRAHIDSPVRLYYQYRNIVVMMRRGYVPLAWKASQCLRSLGKVALVAALPGGRAHRLRMLGRGLRDGLSLCLGPCSGE